MSDLPPPSRLRALRGGRLLVALAVAVAVVLLAGRTISNFFVEILWFDAVGYSSVFWTRFLWRWGARLVAALLVGSLVYVNLRIAAATLGSIQIKRRFGNLEISEQLPRSYVLWGILGVAVLFGLWFGFAMPADAGVRILLLREAPEWGRADAFLGKDLSYYVFTLPVVGSLVTMGLVMLFLTAALSVGAYAATGAVRWTSGRLHLSDVPRVHLGGLLAAFLLVLAARFWIGRELLLLSGSSDVAGIFGYADAHARLPGLRILATVTAMAAVVVAWGALGKRLLPVLTALVAVVATALVAGQVVPALNQRFTVEPNELARETPYISTNLEFTKLGFGLDRMERRSFEYRRDQAVDWEEARSQFDGLPVWSPSTLLTTYREVEARFRYYEFNEVGIDRYAAADGVEPVALSVREIDPTGIPDPNWQNLHLRERYIAGVGAVATAAAERTAGGRAPMILSGIPPEFNEAAPWSPPELRLERPAVYFGARPQLYAIINPSDTTFRGPDGVRGEPGVDFPRGIFLNSGLRLLALAWRFRDANLLFAAEVTDSSRFVFRRGVEERVRAIAPFFEYLEDPYPVVADGRIVWVLEGFTATRMFPLSTVHSLRGRGVSYVRNSVKVTVDAVSGEVSFYAVDSDDPILAAIRRAFPELVRPVSEMPATLQDNLRYPRSLLELQANVLFLYHQETPAVFHGQQDVWQLAEEQAQGTSTVAYQPEYVYYRAPGDEEPSFLLTTVFVPAGRPNLTGILLAGSDPERYGEVLLLDVPVEDQVPGPRNVEVLVEQDPVISQQFSLWRQGGSQVWSGHLHVVPVGQRILYMEPIFLAAEADAIPELRRYVVSDGSSVAMESTLEEAIAALAGSEAPRPRADVPERPAAVGPRGAEWAGRALDLLRGARARLREGDFAGFGERLEELEALLESSRAADTLTVPEPPPSGGGG